MIESHSKWCCVAVALSIVTLASTPSQAQRRRRGGRPTTSSTTAAANAGEPASAQTGADSGASTATSTANTSSSANAGTATSATSTATAGSSATPGTSSAPMVTPTQEPATPPSTATEPLRNQEAVVAPSAPRPVVIDFALGGGIAGRSLFFTDDLFMRLRPYSVAAVPAVHGALQWYPLAMASRGVISGIGIVASGEYSFLFSSTDRQGRSYPTQSFGFSGGLHFRYQIAPMLEAAATVGYQFQTFALDRTRVMEAPADGLPNVTYHALRLGLDARMQIVSRLAVLVAGSYLLPLATGEISSAMFFPRSNAGGVDASVAVAVRLSSWLEVRVGGEWRRFFFKMNPMFNDPLIAGGAADDSYRATVSLAIRR